MSNRTDWKALAREITEEHFDSGTTTAAYENMLKRIETELHNAWVAGQEGSGEENGLNPQPICRSAIKDVEVVVHVEEAGGRRFRRSTKLDTEGLTCTQTQQFEREHGPDGEIVEFVKVGKPTLLLHGKIVGGSNEVVTEPHPPELEVQAQKVANVVEFIFRWRGEVYERYEITEQEMMTEHFKSHMQLMIDRVCSAVGHDKLSPAQVRNALAAACSNHFGVPR